MKSILTQKIQYLFSRTFVLCCLTQATLCMAQSDTLTEKEMATEKVKEYLRLGTYAEKRGAIDSAFVLYKIGAEMALRDTSHFRVLDDIYARVAGIYRSHGRSEEAITYLKRSMHVAQLVHDKRREIQSIVEIGSVFHGMGQFEEAEKYYRYGLDVARNSDENRVLVFTLNSFGDLYRNQKEYEKAIPYHFEAIDTHEKINGNRNEYWAYTSLGKVYFALGEYEKARQCFYRVIDGEDPLPNPSLVAQSYLNLAVLSASEGNLKKAVEECLIARETCNEVNALGIKSYISLKLSEYYEQLGDFKNAYTYHKEYKVLIDSVNLADESNKLKEMIFNQKEQKYLARSALSEERLKNEKESRDEEKKLFVIIIAVSVLLLILSIFYAVFILKNLRENRRQKLIIEEQKEDILQSIHYAKRIQSAILPSKGQMQQLLPEHFVLYKPKDIVAGDFYWLEQMNNGILMAVADCTGHGVPGAMVSVVCHNALKRSVREFGLSDPGDILEQTRTLVIEEFDKSEDDVNDGMDIALVSISPVPQKEATTEANYLLRFAGAHNPLWVIRKGSTEIEDFKAAKQPIGNYPKSEPFQSQELNLKSGDAIYLFSDGFADQFGGPKGKKFRATNLKTLISKHAGLSLDEQLKKLEVTFEDWKGDLDQLDDVCVMGLRL